MNSRKLNLFLWLCLLADLAAFWFEYNGHINQYKQKLPVSLWLESLSGIAFHHPQAIRLMYIILLILLFSVKRRGILSLNAEAKSWRFTLSIALLGPLLIMLTNSQKLNRCTYLLIQPLILAIMPVFVYRLNCGVTTSYAPKNDFGIKNPVRLINTPESFNWQTDSGYINVVNPFQGIFIVGGAGSGKTYSIINEIIRQAVEKDFTGFIYDYKYPDLSDTLNAHLDKKQGPKPRVIQLDFTKPLKSNRVNPLDPGNLPVPLHAGLYAETILRNLKKEWVFKQDFWADNAISYLKAIIWFLKKNHPAYCSLPHAISFALRDYSLVLELLAADHDCRLIISSLLTAYRQNAAAQVAGCISSLQTPLERLNDPAIFWVLSGNECDLELNAALSPSFVVAGNNPLLAGTLGPVISLVATVIMRKLNQKNRLKSIFLLDEAPTLYIPGLKDLPNTGRSNLISTVYCCQDYSQMDLMYGHDESRAIRASLGNQFMGMVNDTATAQQVSQFFGKGEKIVENKSNARNSPPGWLSNDSFSRGSSWQVLEKDLIRPEQILSLPCGAFVGKTTSAYRPFFHGTLKAGLEQISIQGVGYNQAAEVLVELNFNKIHNEAQSILDTS